MVASSTGDPAILAAQYGELRRQRATKSMKPNVLQSFTSCRSLREESAASHRKNTAKSANGMADCALKWTLIGQRLIAMRNSERGLTSTCCAAAAVWRQLEQTARSDDECREAVAFAELFERSAHDVERLAEGISALAASAREIR